MKNIQKGNIIKKWVKCWEQANIALANIREQELSKYSYSKNQTFIDQMLQWAFENKKTRLWSGLVDQQKYFFKLLKKYIPK